MSLDNEKIIEEFTVESQEHLADVENDLLAIEAAGADIDLDLVNKVFRAVHSIKGASGFLGFTTIGELSHSLENILNLIRNKELVPTSAIVDALLRAADALRGLINDIHHSNEADVSEHVDALKKVIAGETSQSVRDSLEQMVRIGEPGRPAFEVSKHTLETQKRFGNHLYTLEFDLIADVEDKGKTPLNLVKELMALGEMVEARLDLANCEAGLDGEIPDTISFVVLFGTVVDVEMLADAFELTPERVHSIDIEDALPVPAEAESHRREETEKAVDTPVPPDVPAAEPKKEVSATAAGASPKPAETNIRVSVGLLDHLMNLAGELVLSRNQLIQYVSSGRLDGLESIASQLDQITSELQESIMQTRMQAIGTVFTKFPRVVRDLSGKLGKQCELTLTGKEVELDKSIIEAIGDPLTHLVRNSIDHGIERPDQRTAKGKNATGTISLKAFHQAGKVNIAIQDDGAGINGDKLKEKAVAKGLITSDQAHEMSERDAVRLIFHPGFSMAEVVSDVSGRGVGMDVVKTNIEKLGGTVDIDTEVGVGTTVQIKLPLTLAIIPSLVVRGGEDRFAIPQVNISELVRIRPNEVARKIERVKDAEVLRLRGNLLPLLRLSTAMGMQSKYLDPQPAELKDSHRERIVDRREPDDAAVVEHEKSRSGTPRRQNTAAGALNIIVVEAGHLRYGLIVDALHDSEEIVVKPLGRHMKDSPCLAGATILGNGNVALILDVAGIASKSQLSAPEEDTARGEKVSGESVSDESQSVLLFTNDPSEQFGAPMGLITRIERIRSEQIDSVGGQEVLQYRGSTLPLLTLESQIKAKPRPEQPKLYVVVFSISGREVGLIAPQLVDIREIPAEMDAVTFSEPGVLGSVIADGKTTRLIDLFALAEKAHPEWFADRQSVETTQGETPTLLLVEDSGFFRSQLTSFMESEGYQVVACEDGLVAWGTLQDPEQCFDLVVTDIEMPNMNGLGLARKIKGDPLFAHLPIVAVTSLASEEDIQRGFEAGIDDYQIKLDREKLVASVARHLKAAKLKAGVTAEQPATGIRS